MANEEELSRLAEVALLQEAKRAALRAESVGPSGWLKPKIPSTNKLFLHNTLKGAVAHNQAKDRRRKKKNESKFEDFENELKKRRKYKKCYLKASTKLKVKKEPSPLKNKKDKLESKAVNGISWHEEGLVISRGTHMERKKCGGNQMLPRNIRFIAESKTRKLEIT